MTTTSIQTLPVLPLPDGVVLPEMVVTISVQSTEAVEVIKAAENGPILLVPRIDGIFAKTGVIASIVDRDALGGRLPTITVRADARAHLGTGVVGSSPVLWLEAERIDDGDTTEQTLSLAADYRAAAGALLDKIGGRQLAGALRELESPGALADSIGYWPELTLERRVELLETVDVDARLRLATTWVKEALADREVQERIQQEVSDDLEKGQREAILRRQMAAIRTELGEGDDDVVGQFRVKLDALTNADGHPLLDEATVESINREIDRLERTGTESTEASWIRTWLDTVFELPWAERSAERLDLVEARHILDADHTGLDDVKDRLIEHLAVRKLRAERNVADDGPDGRRRGVILALVGPPGVGKTSLGESVAEALGRSFVRLALGGIRDEAEIRGHRRTYVGARPGRLVRSLIEAGSMNPVILLDEIDKVSGGWQGDPSAALLEVLDPAQNHSFRDHYLEFELDLSDVVFIATANVLDSIPGPLLDRLELITIDGYTESEKAAIATDHLLPRLLRRNGVRDDEVVFTDDAIATIAGSYTREAGVRGLERLLDKAIRKSTIQILDREAIEPAHDTAEGPTEAHDTAEGPTEANDTAEGPTEANDTAEASNTASEPITIESGDLRDLLGRPIPQEEVVDRIDRPGIATGLAVTGAGGDVLFVETALVDGEGETVLTGQLGDVMKESASIVRSIVGSQADRFGVSMPTDKRVHVHFPAGAVPKDGPSAGVTMTTALVSLLSGRRVRSDVAMTGEVTLQGRVLPIGGVKQKVLAAHRAGITTVLLPAANGPDLEDVPSEVLEAVTVHLVGDIDEVLGHALEAEVREEAHSHAA